MIATRAIVLIELLFPSILFLWAAKHIGTSPAQIAMLIFLNFIKTLLQADRLAASIIKPGLKYKTNKI
jgi:hypothetical protein